MSFLAAGIGLKVASGIYGNMQSKKASSQAQNLANWNAHYIGIETDEQIRKLEKTQEQVMGQARAAIGSSGIKMGGSNQFDARSTNQLYMDELESQFKGEKAWMEKAKVSKQRIARMGGSTQANQIKAQNTQNILGMGGDILGFFK